MKTMLTLLIVCLATGCVSTPVDAILLASDLAQLAKPAPTPEPDCITETEWQSADSATQYQTLSAGRVRCVVLSQ